jgi:hypothetical protein
MTPPNLADKQQPYRLETDQSENNDASNRSFDIGADRNNRELVLAWERWHKQFVATIYYRTERSCIPTRAIGEARLAITVTKDHHISAQLISTRGSPVVAQCYTQGVLGLEGNPGLTFPSGSERDSVTFSYQYVQGHLPYSGYDWKHGDVETVRQEY